MARRRRTRPALVDLIKVLRDLEPVLRRVAGTISSSCCQRRSTPHNLDVEAERVERILVNVARLRTPADATRWPPDVRARAAVVDRTFVEKYPNVRPGSHVLLPSPKRGVRSPDCLKVPAPAARQRPSVWTWDPAGARQRVWRTFVDDAEPSGDMVLKIHLPRRVLDVPERVAPPRHSVLRAA